MKPLILVCTDFSACSELAFPRAAQLAQTDQARVLLVHVCPPSGRSGAPPKAGWDEESGRGLRSARNKYFGELSDNDVQYDTIVGDDAAEAICKVAKRNEASMIVVGSHGRTGIVRQLLGSVAERVVRLAPCSVMVVRGSD